MPDEPVDSTAPVVPLRRRSREFPAHLPREVVEHRPQGCDCPECGGRLRKLGEDASEMLDYVPGYFRVIRHVRPACSCRKCETMVQAPMPDLPIPRGMVERPTTHETATLYQLRSIS